MCKAPGTPRPGAGASKQAPCRFRNQPWPEEPVASWAAAPQAAGPRAPATMPWRRSFSGLASAPAPRISQMSDRPFTLRTIPQDHTAHESVVRHFNLQSSWLFSTVWKSIRKPSPTKSMCSSPAASAQPLAPTNTMASSRGERRRQRQPLPDEEDGDGGCACPAAGGNLSRWRLEDACADNGETAWSLRRATLVETQAVRPKAAPAART
mmetsp:Transcript_69525/g.136492  ORF Transcript_69525/g.136492 Transcript_69525/m.136492 type:complete len:209 (-) Transcript_69525:108-734(-)